MGAADTMVKSCSGERLKKSILVHILLNKEPSLVFGGNRNPPESSGILRNPEEIQEYCPQEFLVKNSCKIGKKTGIPATSPKPRSYEKFLRKTQEKKKS
jgi:hypothetical protein